MSSKACQILAHLADEDIVAFHQYLDCLRRKESTDAAMKKAIEIPLKIARASAAGLTLCGQASGLVHALIAPDLGTAEELLTVNFNLQQLPEDDPYRVEVTAELTLLSQPFRADR